MKIETKHNIEKMLKAAEVAETPGPQRPAATAAPSEKTRRGNSSWQENINAK
jgi:hypothetical protein